MGFEFDKGYSIWPFYLFSLSFHENEIIRTPERASVRLNHLPLSLTISSLFYLHISICLCFHENEIIRTPGRGDVQLNHLPFSLTISSLFYLHISICLCFHENEIIRTPGRGDVQLNHLPFSLTISSLFYLHISICLCFHENEIIRTPGRGDVQLNHLPFSLTISSLFYLHISICLCFHENEIIRTRGGAVCNWITCHLAWLFHLYFISIFPEHPRKWNNKDSGRGGVQLNHLPFSLTIFISILSLFSLSIHENEIIRTRGGAVCNWITCHLAWLFHLYFISIFPEFPWKWNNKDSWRGGVQLNHLPLSLTISWIANINY